MSSKQGDSFEARIALILSSAGFVVKEQPHAVYLNGENVGDLDVLAIDPKTSTLMGVSCKEYLGDTVPGSQHFSHFVRMLEYENIRHGIFASATKVAGTFESLIDYEQNRKGTKLIVLTDDEIKKLESLAFSNQRWDLENYFRTALGLDATGKTTIGNVLTAHKTVFTGKTMEFDHLIPIQYWNTPPDYIKNKDFVPEEATLRLEPYLVVKYDLHLVARHRKTNELLKEHTDEGTYIIDLAKGKILNETDKVFHHIERYYVNAEPNARITEKGFTIREVDVVDNGKVLVNRIKNQIASENVIRTEHINGKEERIPIIVAAKPDDIHTVIHKVYLPIWDVIFKLGKNVYKRTYFAYDGEIIRDEMKNCQICKNQTSYICVECGSTACDKHEKDCGICSNILCTICATSCKDCMTGFCKSHRPTTACSICKSVLCGNCNSILCTKCNKITCSSHREKCEECTSIVCLNDVKTKKYSLVVPKRFCSNECLKKYDEDYNSSGKLGKIKKILGR